MEREMNGLNYDIREFFKYNTLNMGGVALDGERMEQYADKICLEITGQCSDNFIDIGELEGEGKLNIKIRGKNNSIVIKGRCLINRDLSIAVNGTPGEEANGSIIEIGERNFFNGKVYIISPVERGKKVHIGTGNLFARNVLFLGRNGHGIFDIHTGKRVNTDKDIWLGDDNWVCKDAEFYPGAFIKGKTVIASHTLVNKRFDEENILIAGIPGVIKKRNVLWNRYTDEEHFANSDFPLEWGF